MDSSDGRFGSSKPASALPRPSTCTATAKGTQAMQQRTQAAQQRMQATQQALCVSVRVSAAQSKWARGKHAGAGAACMRGRCCSHAACCRSTKPARSCSSSCPAAKHTMPPHAHACTDVRAPRTRTRTCRLPPLDRVLAQPRADILRERRRARAQLGALPQPLVEQQQTAQRAGCIRVAWYVVAKRGSIIARPEAAPDHAWCCDDDSGGGMAEGVE